MNKSTQAVSGVNNHGRQHGSSAHAPRQPSPPPAQAEPRAARPATHRPIRAGGAGRTFSLSPTERSFGEEIRPLAGRSGTEEALAAAKAGDVKAADELEIAWLNAWGPRPTVEQLTGEPNEKWEVVAQTLLREPGGSLIEWWVVQVTCWRCFRRLFAPKSCRACDGSGYDPFAEAIVYYTDADLNPVEIG